MKNNIVLWALLLLTALPLSAQNTDLQKAVARYKKATVVTATATKTSHKDAIAKDVITKGTLTMKKPADVGITIDDGKDQLIMHGSSLASLSDLAVTRQGSHIVLTITPQSDSKKEQRRMLFSSFVLTIDKNTSEIKTLRMNERGGYTEYTFTGYQFK